ncbi:MAG: NAD-dependent epimerase/dehydratase family protein [Actinomycetota bacterium]|nr:NAD-dependent epimerase/dehydratase family protein [Actinomycetota bacterium]
MDNELHVVLGATGGIGSAVVAAATEAGLAVRGVSRSGGVRKGPGGDARAADVSTPEGARHAVEGASVVYHCAQPPYAQWSQHFPPMTATIADACQEVGARLVFADNLYMYEPVAGPIREDSPQHPTSRKGRVRREMADALLARHARGDLSVAIGRASDYFGPHGADSTPGALLFGPLGKGRKPRWLAPWTPRTPSTTSRTWAGRWWLSGPGRSREAGPGSCPPRTHSPAPNGSSALPPPQAGPACVRGWSPRP